AIGGPVTVSLSLPEAVPGFEVFSEQAASAGYGFAIVTDGDDRRGEWTRRAVSGAQSLYFTASLLPTDVVPGKPPSGEARPKADPVFWSNAQETAAADLIASASGTSSEPRSLAREIQGRIAQRTQNAALLLAGGSSTVEVLGKLLNDAGLATRAVMALQLEDARRRRPLLPMLEVFDGERWLLMDPEAGLVETPQDLVLWHRSGRSVLDVMGGRESRLSFSMIQQSVPASTLMDQREVSGVFANLGVNRLPIEEQSMFKLLLLLPMGAAVVVLFRILIGFKTSGTFMPVLIALVFLQTELLPGLLSFVSVVVLGLLLRGYLSHLNLLLVSRIAALIVLVVFVISALSVIGYRLGFSTGMIITFFPMIIIAWTIERLSIVWEEEGPQEVLQQGGGSLAVSIVAYLLMQAPVVQHLSFNFPELNLILLALILVMGQYTGYKLTELWRFAAIRDLQN
ncbi:MAG: UUP1 family membrane protein, partial [Pseudomonadota bacterium]